MMLLLIHVFILAREILRDLAVGLRCDVTSRRHVLCFDNRETRLCFVVSGALSLRWIIVVELHYYVCGLGLLQVNLISMTTLPVDFQIK